MLSATPHQAHPASDTEIYQSIASFMNRTISCQGDLDALVNIFGGPGDLYYLSPLLKDDVVQKYELSHFVLVSIFGACDRFGIETFRVPSQQDTFQGEESLRLHYKKFLEEFREHADGVKERGFYMIANPHTGRCDFERIWCKYGHLFYRYPDALDNLIRDLRHEYEKHKDVS